MSTILEYLKLNKGKTTWMITTRMTADVKTLTECKQIKTLLI